VKIDETMVALCKCLWQRRAKSHGRTWTTFTSNTFATVYIKKLIQLTWTGAQPGFF